MEDAFHLEDGYQGAYRARLDANLAFWDGLDGKTDWPAGGNGTTPDELVLADYLVVDLAKPYAEQGSFLEIERAAMEGRPHETCGGRSSTTTSWTGSSRSSSTPETGRPSATASTTRRGRPRAPSPTSRRRTRILKSPLNTTTKAAAPTENVTSAESVSLELDEIESGALHEWLSPTWVPTC